MAGMDIRESPLLAALDLGSNSFRMELGRMHGGRYRRADYLKETVRLGGGLDADGRLTEAAIGRALECLERFKDRLSEAEPHRLRAVATQTLREARNRDEFLRRAERVLGHPIEVISGREEARLIFLGVALVQPSDARRLVVDIGGRSTEMVLGQGRRPGVAESFAVGSVSLSMRFFPEGVFTERAFRAAQIAAGAELEEGLGTFVPSAWDEVLGASGTVGAVAQVLAAAGVGDGRITLPGLQWCIERCLEAGTAQHLRLPSLREDRKAVIGGGLAILYTLLAQFRIAEMSATKGALRQGVIADMQQRADRRPRSFNGVRDGTILQLQRRFAVDKLQAGRVRDVALSLGSDLGLDDSALRELGWACGLHEIGMIVSHHDHHRHGTYIVAHADAAGFSQDELRRLASLVLAQRGRLGKVADLLSDERSACQVLALRLAALACHARGPAHPKALRASRDGRSVQLRWDARWAEPHPATLFLLKEERAHWAAASSLALTLES